MRVSKEKAVANREALLTAAGRLFRERGIDGVGVVDIGKEAGLTHGALYAHFGSKEELAAAALTKGFERSLAAMLSSSDGRRASAGEYIDFLLSPSMRDGLAAGCPLTASASEIARQGDAVSASFTEGFSRMVEAVEAALGGKLPKIQRRKVAITVIAAEIGAIAVARAVAKKDIKFSEEILGAVGSILKAAARG